MKKLIFLLIIGLCAGLESLYAQATQSIPLGKKGGWSVDTHIPVHLNMTGFNAAINRQLANAQRMVPTHKIDVSDLRLEKGDLESSQAYVVTPQGNIQKSSWQACEYFYKWEKRQSDISTPLEQFAGNREMLQITFDISDEYCAVLAQQQQANEAHTQIHLAHTPGVPVPVTHTDLTVSPAIELPDIDVSLHLVADNQEQPQCAPVVNQEPRSWNEVRQAQGWDPNIKITPRQSKRYLKRFVRENYEDLSIALFRQQTGKPLSILQRRLLTGYDSLCSLYQIATGNTCPTPAELL